MANLIWCGLNCRLIIVPFDTEVMDAVYGACNGVKSLFTNDTDVMELALDDGNTILVEEIDDAPDDAGVEDIDVNEKDVAFVAYEL
ncbi:6591_t:CDS:2 [Entrophospora sp. SA101]|nr:6591_t:CDS:2 [Entrophospora sp. SA101]